MLTLTPDATHIIEDMLTTPGTPEGAGLRIESSQPNAANAADLQASVAAEPDAGDQVIEDEGARVFLDGAVVEFLDDKLLDANVEDNKVRFALQDRG